MAEAHAELRFLICKAVNGILIVPLLIAMKADYIDGVFLKT